jgi:ankyrin repeat protein
MQLNKIILSVFLVGVMAFFYRPAHAGEIVDDTLQALQLDNASGVIHGLKRGLDVNFVDAYGNTLLMLAAREDSPKSAAVLIDAGAKLYLRNVFGDDALLLATFAGHEAIVDILLAKGAIAEANPRGWTPLHYAAFAGHLGLVNKFLASGADINAITQSGMTPLIAAAMKGHIDVVRSLLNAGADTELRDSKEMSASDHALAHANTDIAELIAQAFRKK